MKSAEHWILCLLFFQVICLQGQEAAVNDAVARLIRDADEVRVVHVDNSGPTDTLTGYQSVLPAGSQALAQAFADANMTLFRHDDGSNDAGGVGSSTYLMLNVRTKGKVVGDILVIGYLVYVCKPGKLWYYATFADAPWTDNSIPSEKSFMERRILGMLEASLKHGGGWKKMEGSLKGFLNVDLP